MIFTKNDISVFLSWDIQNRLEEIARTEMENDPIWIVNSINHSSKEYSEKMDIYYSKIRDFRDKYPERFEKEMVKLNLIGKKAQENCWRLLNEYCKRNSLAYLVDNRPFENQLQSDYQGDSYGYYPLGRKFSLVYKIPELKNWYGKKIQNDTEIKIMIDTKKVTKITGEFGFLFTIFTSEREYIFGRGLSILPVK